MLQIKVEYVLHVLNMQDCINSKVCANDISQLQFRLWESQASSTLTA